MDTDFLHIYGPYNSQKKDPEHSKNRGINQTAAYEEDERNVNRQNNTARANHPYENWVN
jgi:hypothetical protein